MSDQVDTAPKNKGGRPKGSISKRAQADIDAARDTGLLPHEILLHIARGLPLQEVNVNPLTGEQVITYLPPADLQTRASAAKDAAPYYAPKLATVEVLTQINDDDLDSLIASLATQAGVGLTPDGEGEEGGQEAQAVSRPRRRIRINGD